MVIVYSIIIIKFSIFWQFPSLIIKHKIYDFLQICIIWRALNRWRGSFRSVCLSLFNEYHCKLLLPFHISFKILEIYFEGDVFRFMTKEEVSVKLKFELKLKGLSKNTERSCKKKEPSPPLERAQENR